MSYAKPKGLLLAEPAKRIRPKSAFLRKLEKRQAEPESNVVSIRKRTRKPA